MIRSLQPQADKQQTWKCIGAVWFCGLFFFFFLKDFISTITCIVLYIFLWKCSIDWKRASKGGWEIFRKKKKNILQTKISKHTSFLHRYLLAVMIWRKLVRSLLLNFAASGKRLFKTVRMQPSIYDSPDISKAVVWFFFFKINVWNRNNNNNNNKTRKKGTSRLLPVC